MSSQTPQVAFALDDEEEVNYGHALHHIVALIKGTRNSHNIAIFFAHLDTTCAQDLIDYSDESVLCEIHDTYGQDHPPLLPLERI